tara:strand:- start:5082 stop:5960 length:879 start_codon:yes stop_codon:yes gene_type:complete
MLEGAFTSPKIRMLAAITGKPWPHCLGLAGLLWRFAGKHAPTGAVGTHSDEEIALSLEWTDDPALLVEALVRCRLLDEAPRPERLLVHDWPEHAPRYVRASLQRQGLDFSPRYAARHHAVATRYDAATTDPTTDDATDATTATTADGSTSSSSSSSSLTSTTTSSSRVLASVTADDLAGKVWNCYLPGRKQGKMIGVEAIRRSMVRVAMEEGKTIEDVAKMIADRTAADVARWVEELRTGENEIKFIPQGATYFKQERWNDGNEEISERQIREARIGDEIARARARAREDVG